MKQNNLTKKQIVITSLISIIIVLSVPNIISHNYDDENIQNKIEEVQNVPKSSGFWSVPFIYINNNWSHTAGNFSWCSGSGNYTHPYIIENVTTTSNSPQGHCIIIINSIDYFIIKNCTTSTSGSNFDDFGIYLFNVENGTIYNNSITNNPGSGLGIYTGCNNITVYNNTIKGNTVRGIFMSGSSDINISKNDIIANAERGLYIGVGSNDLIIEHNNIFGQFTQTHGISLWSSCNDIEITDNIIKDHTSIGVLIDNGSYNNTIKENEISGSWQYGIQVTASSYDNKIIDNDLTDNGNEGIRIQQSDDCIIRDNRIDGIDSQGDGIVLVVGTDRTQIINNTIHDCVNVGIEFYNTITDNSVINNTIYDNDLHGIHFWANFGPISNNYIFNNTIYGNNFHGIYMQETTDPAQYNRILNNTIRDNLNHGIFLEGVMDGNNDGFHHNVIKYNTIFSNQFVGIYAKSDCVNTTIMYNKLLGDQNNGIQIAEDSSDCIITDNYIVDHYFNGINVDTCNYTTIANNTIVNCLQDGITLITSFNTTVEDNEVRDNKGHGIIIRNTSHKNNITDNDILNSNKSGIYITDNSDNNIIMLNLIYNSTDYGLLISSNDCDYNLIYLNNFTLNGINAYDNSTNNNWNNGTIGNYYDDYTGCDDNDDGIGDTPYDIPGNGNAEDNKPICYEDCEDGGGGGETDDDDDDDDDDEGMAIPMSNYYLIFGILSILSLIFIVKRRISLN